MDLYFFFRFFCSNLAHNINNCVIVEDKEFCAKILMICTKFGNNCKSSFPFEPLGLVHTYTNYTHTDIHRHTDNTCRFSIDFTGNFKENKEHRKWEM